MKKEYSVKKYSHFFWKKIARFQKQIHHQLDSDLSLVAI
jgi:hypothetical protein